MAKATTKKRKVIVESTGEAHISATNNIIISLTNKKGEVISWSSAGKMGFRGSKRTRLTQLKWQQKIAAK
jgi:small subunit ribosomal protein S11